ILDEPLVALDLGMRELFLSWLGRIVDSGGTAIVSTHEIEPFLDQVGGVIVMRAGRPTVHALPTTGIPAQLAVWARGAD
ncbi:MAG: hypothetical protein KC729_02310, partial [Candidatus Eisenbacteria bacterium]|nr:hypothetical protein [Candidatus Eisenbacteria bacterium]